MNLEQKRSLYIPQGAFVVRDKQSSAIAYIAETSEGTPIAVVFGGKRSKPDLNYSYATAERRNSHVAKMFEYIRKRDERSRQRRQPQKRTLEVGDILYTSWGYEQTNVDFYQVTGLVGKASATLRKVGADMEPTEGMSGKKCAIPGKFTGEPFTVRVNGDCCKVDGQHARKWGGKPVYCSWYH